ncbi:MAG TPA: GAF domain-containing protein [Myxococcales bacterium]|nr:GAF domain-containing protein [Myxococcales bacterium]
MLGEQLVGAGLLHPDRLAEAKLHQELTGKDLVEALLTLGMVPERDLLRVLAQHHQMQYLTTEKIAGLKVPDELLDQVKVRVAESMLVMPIRRNPDGTLWVLGTGPLPELGEDRLKKEGGAKKVNVILARPASIRAAIRRHYYRDPDAFASLDDRGPSPALGPMTTEPSLPAVASARGDDDDDDDEPTRHEDLSHQERTRHEELTTTPTMEPQSEGTDPNLTVTSMEPLGGRTMIDSTDHGGDATQAHRVQPEGEITRKVKLAISDAQQLLERENQRLRVALSLAAALGQLHKQEDVTRDLLVALLDLFPADGAAYAILGDQGRPAHVETLRREGAAAFQISASLIAAACAARHPLVSGNVGADPRLQGESTLISRGVRSILIAPVRSREGRPTGALYVEARDQAAFTSESGELLRLVAQVAGVAVDSIQLIVRLEHQARARAIHERFLSGQRAAAASLGAPAFDLRARTTEGTFLHVRPLPPLRPRSGESASGLIQRLELHVDSVSARIHAHGGVLESTSRGEVSAVFGGPDGDDRHDRPVENALAAAVEILSLAASSDGRTAPVSMGAASGTVLAGGAGRSGQLHYAVLGEPADLARALAATAPSMDLHASEATESQSGRSYRWEPFKLGVSFGGEIRPVFRLMWR